MPESKPDLDKKSGRWHDRHQLFPLWLPPVVARHIRLVALQRGYRQPKDLVLAALRNEGVFVDAPERVREALNSVTAYSATE